MSDGDVVGDVVVMLPAMPGGLLCGCDALVATLPDRVPPGAEDELDEFLGWDDVVRSSTDLSPGRRG